MKNASSSHRAALPPSRARRPAGPGHRLTVAARTLAGLGGGYALAAFFTTALALLSQASREEAAAFAAVPSYLVFAAAIVWAFAARTVARAWLGIALPALALAALTAWLVPHAAP